MEEEEEEVMEEVEEVMEEVMAEVMEEELACSKDYGQLMEDVCGDTGWGKVAIWYPANAMVTHEAPSPSTCTHALAGAPSPVFGPSVRSPGSPPPAWAVTHLLY